MSKTIDLYIDQGADFVATFPPVTTSDGSVVDLTPYTVVCQIRRSYATLFSVELTTAADADGVIEISLLKDETGGLTPTRYVYDVIIIDTHDISTKVFDGLVTVNPGVSVKPNTTLITPYIPDDFGGL